MTGIVRPTLLVDKEVCERNIGRMAILFADNGWKDITIAFPLNVLEINNVNQLAEKIKLQVLVENIDAVNVLKEKLLHTVGVWIKIDTGYNRTGIDAVAFNETDAVVAAISNCEKLVFKGFLSHTGQTYLANSTDEILRRHFDALVKLKTLYVLLAIFLKVPLDLYLMTL